MLETGRISPGAGNGRCQTERDAGDEDDRARLRYFGRNQQRTERGVWNFSGTNKIINKE